MRNLYDGYYEQDTPGQNKMKRVQLSIAQQDLQTEYNQLYFSATATVSIASGSEFPPERSIEAQQCWICTIKKCLALCIIRF